MGNKVKRIFVGTNQVYPVWRYSYDFRNKSTSQITTDGWSYSAWDTPSFSSYGVRGNSVRITKDLSLTNAKRMTLSGYGTLANTAFAVYAWKTVTSSLREGLSWPYLSAGSNLWRLAIYDDSTHSFSGISAWSYNFEWVFDFENKTWELSVTWKTTQSWTLTDTEVSNIRNNVTKLFVFVSGTNSSSWLATMSIKIEY